MKSPKRGIAYVAEYEFAEDNVLTATYHEEMRLRNEERLKQVQSVLKLRDMTLYHPEDHVVGIHNPKRLQQEVDRKDEIEHNNLRLLQRLERIHGHVPKQFDVSHHSEFVLNAPRATNAGLRRKEQERIAQENKKLKRRLNQTKTTLDAKQLAHDAEKHRYYVDQISKVERRRKAKDAVKFLHDQALIKASASCPTMPLAHSTCPSVEPPPLQRRLQEFVVADHQEEDERVSAPPPPKLTSPTRLQQHLPAPKLPAVVHPKASSKYQTEEYFPTLRNSSKHIEVIQQKR